MRENGSAKLDGHSESPSRGSSEPGARRATTCEPQSIHALGHS